MNQLTHIIQSYVQSYGTIGIGIILFIEMALLIGLILPGDSLLFILALSTPHNYKLLLLNILITTIATTTGAQIGYLSGKLLGHKIIDNHKHPKIKEAIDKSYQYISKYGIKKSILISRFIPFVRTILNIIIGYELYNYKLFTIYNILSGTIWTITIMHLGYFVGKLFPISYFTFIIIIIVIISITPIIIKNIHNNKNNTNSSKENP